MGHKVQCANQPTDDRRTDARNPSRAHGVAVDWWQCRSRGTDDHDARKRRQPSWPPLQWRPFGWTTSCLP